VARQPERMKAMVYERYGPPDVLSLVDIEQPVPGDHQVLVKVHAAAVNPYDWHQLTGTPYLMRPSSGLRRPKSRVLGLDLAGTIEAVGHGVTRFRPGDEVFGARGGSFAEYVCVREDGVLLPKPANLPFEQAAAVPLAALSALQALRDHGGIRPGQQVLIVGAAGGIGTFAVQLAKAFGAEVTGVCSTGNMELVRGLGADRVIDYTREDFTRTGHQYDLILDNVGTRSIADRRRLLTAGGVLVGTSGPKTNRWLGPMTAFVKLTLAQRLGRVNAVQMLTKLDRDDLSAIRELLEVGAISPVIDRNYPLADLPEALAYVGTGHARAKVVITL
jgi:NADPH:quinone reductase-like Zn-dependent oxidoreductase